MHTPITEYLSSEKTDDSDHSSLLALGKRLVEEFERDCHIDTLTRWMAHWIAEKIELVEKAGEVERPSRMLEASDAILKVWEHRNNFPHGRRPFEKLEPILSTLAGLSAEGDRPRLYSFLRSQAGESESSGETKKWLELATGIDDGARVLIRYCLACAAEQATDHAQEWVRLLTDGDSDLDLDVRIVRMLADNVEAMTTTTPEELQAKQIAKWMSTLQTLGHCANQLTDHFRAILETKSQTDE